VSPHVDVVLQMHFEKREAINPKIPEMDLKNQILFP
jgi:hypothetical protein